MVSVIIAGSRFIFIILFGLFVYQAFRMKNIDRPEEKKNIVFKSQLVFILCIHSMAFLVIGTTIYTDSSNDQSLGEIILFFAVLFVYYLVFNLLAPVIYEKINRGIISAMSMFLCISFIELTRLSFDKAVKQFYILLVGTVLFFMIPVIIGRIKKLERFLWIYCGLGLMQLLAVLFFADTDNGAKLAIDFGLFSFQPLEFVKILFVLFLAALFNYGNDFKTVVISAVLAGIYVIILVLSNDLGSALILCLVYLFMLYVATKKGIYLLGGLVLGAGGSVLAYKFFDHVQVRVEAWLDPWPDIADGGYQITQSLFAIGTGGWLGSGIYQGMPYKIPEVTQDFIFSAIAEEFGGVFAIFLILLCGCFFIYIMKISMIQTNMFKKLTVLGLGCIYGVQLFLTIGGAMKMIPSTGVTLPLISSGGSSILATMILLSIVQTMFMNVEKEEEQRSDVRIKPVFVDETEDEFRVNMKFDEDNEYNTEENDIEEDEEPEIYESESDEIDINDDILNFYEDYNVDLDGVLDEKEKND